MECDREGGLLQFGFKKGLRRGGKHLKSDEAVMQRYGAMIPA